MYDCKTPPLLFYPSDVPTASESSPGSRHWSQRRGARLNGLEEILGEGVERGVGEGPTTVRGIIPNGLNCPSMNGGNNMSLALSEPVYKITCPARSKENLYSICAMLFTTRVRCPICYESIKAAEHFRRTELRDLLRQRGFSGYFFGANGHSFSPARE